MSCLLGVCLLTASVTMTRLVTGRNRLKWQIPFINLDFSAFFHVYSVPENHEVNSEQSSFPSSSSSCR